MEAVAAAPVSSPRALLPASWPLWASFGMFPIAWLLGLGGFVWILVAVPMAFHLLARGTVEIPRGFGLYALFLLWVLGSATQLEGFDAALVFTYRLSLYAAAGVFFLYIYNEPPHRLPAREVVGALAAFWVVVTLGGFAGLIFPAVSLHTPLESAMPGMSSNEWLHDLVHVRFAQVQEFLGYPIARPSAPFPYTNMWGSSYSLLLPFALLVIARRSRSPWKAPLLVLLAVSVVPAVLSVNRGLWLSVGLALAYVAVRSFLSGRVRYVALVLLAGVVALVAVGITPLGDVVEERLANQHSNRGRLSLYEQAIEGAAGAPLFGYGAPLPSENPRHPNVGTHGLFWMILVSHGIPAAVLFVTWLLLVLWRTRTAGTAVQLASNVVVFTGLVQITFYGLLPGQLFIVMAAAGLAWRESAIARERRLAEPVGRER